MSFVIDRTPEPERFVALLGPTNSGKTHEALGLLAKRGRGCYAGPLRLLALEVYEKLKAQGLDVGLVTGEESVDPSAAIVCCTPECAPASGDTLVVDECHWLQDSKRGFAWTRLVVAVGRGDWHYARFCGAGECRELLEVAVPGICVVEKTRFSRLSFGGRWSRPLAELKRDDDDDRVSAIASFSRASALAVAAACRREGLRVACLYGSLPPRTRLNEISRVRRGEVDVVSCTDVIGHGLNLPLDVVLFAQTDKFDGDRRRPLTVWECAQIAGRAGRGEKGGEVYALDVRGLGPSDEKLLRSAVDVANGDARADDLRVRVGFARPTFRDLKHADTLNGLADALDRWHATLFETRTTTPEGLRGVAEKPTCADYDARKFQVLEEVGDAAHAGGGDIYRLAVACKAIVASFSTVDDPLAVELLTTCFSKATHPFEDPNVEAALLVAADHCVKSEASIAAFRDSAKPFLESVLATPDDCNGRRQIAESLLRRRPRRDDATAWIVPIDVAVFRERIEDIGFCREPDQLETAWKIACLPVDDVRQIARAVLDGYSIYLPVDKILGADDPQILENALLDLGDIIVAARAFPDIFSRHPPPLLEKKKNRLFLEGGGERRAPASSGDAIEDLVILYDYGAKRLADELHQAIDAGDACANKGCTNRRTRLHYTVGLPAASALSISKRAVARKRSSSSRMALCASRSKASRSARARVLARRVAFICSS
ncbi:hypothetical protein CTAYLR_003721 [Chrysophaeum taylorii]|uniref:RNA helicase n=1 Tax=Chrysophaeum taylorii TaxID=2483200 RepID=A0AAD7UMT4_9STRA|nr:hypothetical protein CTAYLR_003721 [Chrysophaeum taylorii]